MTARCVQEVWHACEAHSPSQLDLLVWSCLRNPALCWVERSVTDAPLVISVRCVSF